MNAKDYIIRDATPSEFAQVGALMVDVYSRLDGFPKPSEQPKYYDTLTNVGSFIELPKVRLLIAITHTFNILGAVVYFGDMQYYGSGGSATKEKIASGFRLLAVSPSARGQGVGKQLTEKCIELAMNEKQTYMVIHSTLAMKIAWKMYENMGFKRSEDLDFLQENLQVFGFRLLLS